MLRLSRIVRRTLLSCAGLCLAALALELGVRVVAASPQRLEQEGRLHRPARHQNLPYENLPNGRRSVRHVDRKGRVLAESVMTTNADGFRGPEVPKERTPGLARVACLGDSFTFGFGVADGESWPDHLRRLYRERGQEVEVLNCGVNGYHTADEVRLLQQRVTRWKPDLVVLQYFVNDVSARGLDLDGDPGEVWYGPWLLKDGHLAGLRRVSVAVDLVCSRLASHFRLQSIQGVRGGTEQGFQRVCAALEACVGYSEAMDTPVLLALYPLLVDGGTGLLSDEAYSKVRAYAHEIGLPVLDASDAFRGISTRELRISDLDFHGNSRANGLFAGAVLTELDRRGWPKSPNGTKSLPGSRR